MKQNRRAGARPAASINPFRARHLALAEVPASLPECGKDAQFDAAESPLVWLARRKGADGRPLIAPHHFQAGERLRADFSIAQMMPRTTANWHSPAIGRRRDGQPGLLASERAIDAKRRTRSALDDVGTEFAGLLLDVCCFLKRLEDVERERRWPARSAKVVLQLALERLSRHYGIRSELHGKERGPLRTWFAEDDPSAASPAAVPPEPAAKAQAAMAERASD